MNAIRFELKTSNNSFDIDRTNDMNLKDLFNNIL